MSPELTEAIERTKQLFIDRCRSEDWGQNIIQGSRGIQTVSDWTKYYSFLSNPTGFDENAEIPTINGEEVIEGPPPGLEVVEYKNGAETTIVYKRILESEDDEKVPE